MAVFKTNLKKFMQVQSKMDDSSLIALYQEGEKEAMSELVNRHKEKIFTSIVLLVKDHSLAEDIFQETFIKIIKKFNSGQYKEKGKFLPWAIRIAHNMCVDHFRRKKRMPMVRNNEEEDIFNLIPFSDPGAEEDMITRQSRMQVRKMLDMLSPEQREVIILRHYGGLSFKEISVQTNVSINTALGRMRYGLINLRKIMEKKEICL